MMYIQKLRKVSLKKKRKYVCVFMALVAFVYSYEKNKKNKKDFEPRYIHQAIFKIVNSLHTSM